MSRRCPSYRLPLSLNRNPLRLQKSSPATRGSSPTGRFGNGGSALSFDVCLDEIEKIVKRNGLLGYIYKGRKFRKAQDLRKTDFSAVKGLAKDFKKA